MLGLMERIPLREPRAQTLQITLGAKLPESRGMMGFVDGGQPARQEPGLGVVSESHPVDHAHADRDDVSSARRPARPPIYRAERNAERNVDVQPPSGR